MAGVTYIVNPLLNENLEISGLVAGDTDAAFARGCELGREQYATQVPDAFDIGVFSAFPKDTELCQAGLAMTPLSGTKKNPFNENSTTVMCSASPEGLGWHSVLGPGTALRGKPSPPAPAHHFIFAWDQQVGCSLALWQGGYFLQNLGGRIERIRKIPRN